MNKKIRMADIAEAMNVSIVTVSKALSGKDGVSSELRDKIREKALELGYQIKNDVKSVIDGESVGILVFDRFLTVNQSFYWRLYEKVLMQLSLHNMFGMLELVSAEDARACNIPRLLQNGRVGALILIGTMSPKYIQMIVQSGLPIVQLDSDDVRFGLDAVISDGYYGMYVMTDYLIRKGHRDIAYLGLVGETGSITDRYFGYCRALMEHGIELKPEWVLSDRDEEGETRITLPETMPDAFVCNCDVAAYHLTVLLGERGLKVPEDISVVGFDDFCFPNLPDFRITTYAVDLDSMAKESVRQLIERQTAPDNRRQLKIVTGHLVEKDTVRSLLADK